MNSLAQFIYSKISGNLDDCELQLSSLEKRAWKDLQMDINYSSQDMVERARMYTSPAEWPTGITPFIKFDG